ncbi:hypothetical protein [Occallatibacter riparius]|uniref:DUF4136 domain-containing protein n=1 Tax=Occallatibacter riparius TaxID=1002689 RepID=A0A9J7BWK7_9BACT|nr:hypothetical protein [Occallatibacter riparius]UWZ86194.1 hypothetical protein MOP44_09670 [Occallatibacter riparius]
MRRSTVALVMVLVLMPVLAFAQTKKKKKSVPAVFSNAHYVYVQAEDGDAYTPGLLNEDRAAIENVQGAIREWNRYALTMSVNEAELVFVVRKGRVASGRVGGSVGVGAPYPGQPPTTRTAGMGEAEVGPPDDLLEVKMRNADGSLSAPIWIRTQSEGLDRPRVPLFQMLRDAVERDYPM